MLTVKKIAAGLSAIVIAFTLVACEADSNSGQDKERGNRQSGYDRAVERQPAPIMDFSPTRKTIGRWAETWQEEGKLAYVYLLNASGDTVGYYVIEGLPVSYCASLTPTYDLKRVDAAGGNQDVVVPAPGIDQAYYGASGGLCSTYYGFDATTGAYIEYTTGQGINALLYDQPLPRFEDAQPLSDTSIEDVK